MRAHVVYGIAFLMQKCFDGFFQGEARVVRGEDDGIILGGRVNIHGDIISLKYDWEKTGAD